MAPSPLRPPGFEGKIALGEPEKRENSFELERAFQSAQVVIDREAIDPRKLGKPYNDQDIQAHMQYVRDKEKEFVASDDNQSKRARKLAKILEVAIHQQVNSQWFGPNVHSTLPSKYDDYRNGVDLIVELDIPEYSITTHAAMGIDVTYSEELKRKIHGILEAIDSDELATIRHYKSRDGSDVGSKYKVPKLVVGMDEKSAKIVARAWYENNPALKKDPIREGLLIQLIDQCSAFEQYAIAKGKKDTADKYRRNKIIFQKIFGREVQQKDRAKFSNDEVFKKLELLINQLPE